MKSRILLITLLLIGIFCFPVYSFEDRDNDGFYKETGVNEGLADNKEDCDDFDPNVHPDMQNEIFDGKDNDCDGEVDENLYWKQRKSHNLVTIHDNGSRIYYDFIINVNDLGEGYQNLISNVINGEYVQFPVDSNYNPLYPLDLSDFLNSYTPENNKSFCWINASKETLDCDIYDSNHWIEVYQNVTHLREGDYEFTYDLVSGTRPNIKIIIGNNEECTSYPCDNFEVEEDEKVDIIFRFTSDSRIDNVSLTLTDDGNNLSGIRSTLQSEPFMMQSKPASCCPSDYCWTGEKCVYSEEYMKNTTMPPIVMNDNQDGYRCIKNRTNDVIGDVADWTFSELKSDPFNYQKGYCPYPDMCLVTTNVSENFTGDYNNGPPYYGCAKNGNFTTNEAHMSDFFYDDQEYFKDFYCDNGNWTSRTKFIAMTLLEIGKNSGHEFLLFCDKAKKENSTDIFSSLNYFYHSNTQESYSIEPSIFDSNIYEHLFNNFCTLVINNADGTDNEKTGEVFDRNDQVIIGTALNVKIDDSLPGTYTPPSIEGIDDLDDTPPDVNVVIDLLFEDSCVGINFQDTGYSRCSDNLYYNDNLWTLIYSTQDISGYSDELGEELNVFQKLIGFIPNLFENIVNLFRSSISLDYNLDESYLNNDDTFQKLYIASVGGIQIEGINQRKRALSHFGYQGLTDYAYFKFINYPICKQEGQNAYQLDISPQSETMVLSRYIKYSDIADNKMVNCTVTIDGNGDEIHSFVIEGNIPDSDHKIDEIWYDLTAKLRPLK